MILGNISFLRGWTNIVTVFLAEVVDVPCLSRFKKQLDSALNNMPWIDQAVGLDYPCRFLPIGTIVFS